MGPLSRAVLGLLLLPASASAGDKEIVQLSGVFPDAAVRDQGDYGACHSFAGVAVLENAIRRSGGGDRRLSEADLFLRYAIRSERYIDIPGGESLDLALRRAILREGSMVEEVIGFALKTGVATQHSVPWSETVRYYEFYKKNLRSLLDAERERCEAGKRACPRPLASRSAYDSYMSYVQHLRDANPDPGPLLIPGAPEKLEAEREETRRLLAGFKLRSVAGLRFTDPPGEDCKRLGRPVRDALVAAIRSHAPVAVGMALDNLPGWHANTGGHAFVLTGFLRDGDRYTFKTRNSWGGDNPDVADDQLCHVRVAAWLEGPGGD